jgi:hypothetical protein
MTSQMRLMPSGKLFDAGVVCGSGAGMLAHRP